MIEPGHFCHLLEEHGIDFFAGIPDSLLKDFCAYLLDHIEPSSNVITANEGSAVALASGRYLASGRPGLVYLQNSGLGNAVNPLISLNDPLVYGIPVLLLIGWRGEPGHKDEPQHKKQGLITTRLLRSLDIPYTVISKDTSRIAAVVKRAAERMKEQSRPVAIVVKAGTFVPYVGRSSTEEFFELTREEAIETLCSRMERNTIIVSTTGKTSRELYEYRERAGQGHEGDFLTIGSMGHCSQIALGIALEKPSRQILCLDGDGSALMHMGNLALNGRLGPVNFRHVILNNRSHDSVGGQPTVADRIDFLSIAGSCGYQNVFRVRSQEALGKTVDEFLSRSGPSLLEIVVRKGSRKDLGRPRQDPQQLKNLFINELR